MKTNFKKALVAVLLYSAYSCYTIQAQDDDLPSGDNESTRKNGYLINDDSRGGNSFITLYKDQSPTSILNHNWQLVNLGPFFDIRYYTDRNRITAKGTTYLSLRTQGSNIGVVVPHNLYINNIHSNGSNTLRLNGNIAINRDNALANFHVAGTSQFDGRITLNGEGFFNTNLMVGGRMQVNEIRPNGSPNISFIGNSRFDSPLTVSRNGNRSIIVNASDQGNIEPAEIAFDKDGGSQRAAVGMGPINRDFFVWVNGYDRMTINEAGKATFSGDVSVAGILSVKGRVRATDYTVISAADWSDFVFSDGYKLRSLKETEAFILKNKHLPTIPSESEVKENGYNMHEMNTKFLQTIEELTLHAIEQEKKIASQNNEMEKMQKELEEIKMLLSSKK
jgi:hypothetical protein